VFTHLEFILEIVLLPDFFFAQMEPRARGHLNRCLSAIIACLALPLIGIVPHVCLMQWALHRPCPGCGVTTGLRSLISLNLPAAWRSNPASFAVVSCLAYQIVVQPFGIWASESSSAQITLIAIQLSRLAVAALLVVWLGRLI
jgi:hypothetical protein